MIIKQGSRVRGFKALMLICILFFLPLTPHFSLITVSNAQPVLSAGSPAPWDSQDTEPGSVIKDGNLFKMWYTGYNGKRYRIGYAVSSDGFKWEKSDLPVFEHSKDSSSWDNSSAAYPCVIKDGNIYKMWYTGSNGRRLSIGYATSNDGISWDRHKNPVFEPAIEDTWDGFSVQYPMVVKDSRRYLMFYTGSAGVSYKIGAAESSDGISWKRLKNSPIDFGRVHSFHPWIIKDSKGYKMWYSIKTEPKAGFKIGLADSRDGIIWEMKGDALKPDLGWEIKEVFKPVVLRKGDNYLMFYAGFDGRRTRIGFAESADGNRWIRHKMNPVLGVGEGAGWDGDSVFSGSVIKDGDTYRLWYSGFNGNKTKIGFASSKDGINWRKSLAPVFTPGDNWDRMGAGYPSVIKEGKTYRMWYTGYDGRMLQIGYAYSDDGLNWHRYKDIPVLKTGNGWDSTQAAYPCVIKESNGYRMYYVGYNNKEEWIGVAVSKDGINWEKISGNPVIKGKGIISPWVVKDGSAYRMWYSVYGDNGYEIHFASSIDGIKWKRHGVQFKPDGMIKDIKGPMVIMDNGVYKMWYEEFDGSKNRIAFAYSKDGYRWQRFEGHKAIDPGAKDGWDSFGVAGGWILKEHGKYRMWYSGHDGDTFRIGYAVSNDGINWQRFDKNPVFDKGNSGSWDDVQVAYPFVMRDGDMYKMWYYGYGGSPKYPPSIGYAASYDGINWERYTENPVLMTGDAGSWDDEMVAYPVIIKEGSVYKMWYGGSNKFGEWKIGYAESKDGIKWTKLLSPVLIAGGKEEWDGYAVSYPMVVSVEGGYFMWYTGVDANNNGGAMRIGAAFSEDGISWIKPKEEPLIDIGDNGEWNEASSFSPRVIKDGNLWKIWFTGFDLGRVFRIGYMEKGYEDILQKGN